LTFVVLSKFDFLKYLNEERIKEFSNHFQFAPKVLETSALSIEASETSVATSEAVPKLKETASRAAKSTGFEPSVEEAGSMHDLVLEEQQTASQGFEAKKEEQFLRRERQRGVSCKMMVVFK
jgi:hypothetical protein